jgi:hypothetical protein
MTRSAASVEEPAVQGTIMVTGRVGNSCAGAADGIAAAIARPARVKKAQRRAIGTMGVLS